MRRLMKVAIAILFALLVSGGVLLSASDLKESNDLHNTWIVKWNGEAPERFWQETVLIEKYDGLGVFLVRPDDHIDSKHWESTWKSEPGIAYIHENQQLKLLSAPSDPFLSEQSHLQLIGARQAWDVQSENNDITIAIVDTGVDLDHPDLADNIVEGFNLLNPSLPPDDDAGHGTKVAGVIAATGNNDIGVAGLLWNTNIMPIKVMDADGNGREIDLGEGIRHAVDNGADIIVLSLGLYRYSPFIEEVVQYAEEQGVLLVAASGNDGKEVQYPAAYPTVLAVGGVNASKEVYPTSNYGTELDLVAPWHVYTTMKGGGYVYDQGTSMAAPQVAGAAALVMSEYPDLKPYQVRNLLRQTAEDLGEKGWDIYSGYGLLRVDRALTEAYKEDFYEPNDTLSSSKILPLGKMTTAELSSRSDKDWFKIQSKYTGTVQITLEADSRRDLQNIVLTHHNGTPSANNGTEYPDLTKTIELHVDKNTTSYVMISAKSSMNGRMSYKITTNFLMAPDEFESNDQKYSATSLLPRQHQVITGNFHRENDKDWFVLNIRDNGVLNVELTSESYRIDPRLRIEKLGQDRPLVDKDIGGPGDIERSGSLEVSPGRYYILVSNIVSPVIGEYTLSIRYEQKYVDPNEPNDEPFQAVRILRSTDYFGMIDSSQDEDWFSFRLDKTSYVTLKLDQIPANRVMSLNLYSGINEPIAVDVNQRGVRQIRSAQALEPGNYYVRITADDKFENQQYKFRVDVDPLDGGYRDITGHWAYEEINELTERRIISGYLDYTFRPNHPITRAEATMMISKAIELKPKRDTAIPYRDVAKHYWAYEAIQYASRSEMISGYPNGTFQPSRELTRAEMAVMLAKALGLEPAASSGIQFTDVSKNHWAAAYIQRMTEEGLLAGYHDGEFRPNANATRAELSSLIYRVLRPD